jgi:hypothetical protein
MVKIFKMLRSLKSLNRNQLGITLMELMVAMLISAIITGSITMTIFQVFDSSSRTNSHMTAVTQVRSAGYWMSHDVLMAQDLLLAAEPGFPLTLTWSDWTDNEVHTVVYSIVDDELRRSHSINSGLPENAVVADFIDPASTSCQYTGGTFIFTITSTVGAGSAAQTESRTFEVVPRTG